MYTYTPSLPSCPATTILSSRSSQGAAEFLCYNAASRLAVHFTWSCVCISSPLFRPHPIPSREFPSSYSQMVSRSSRLPHQLATLPRECWSPPQRLGSWDGMGCELRRVSAERKHSHHMRLISRAHGPRCGAPWPWGAFDGQHFPLESDRTFSVCSLYQSLKVCDLFHLFSLFIRQSLNCLISKNASCQQQAGLPWRAFCSCGSFHLKEGTVPGRQACSAGNEVCLVHQFIIVFRQNAF